MMRKIVMPLGHANERIAAIAAGVSEHERRDARQIGLECQHQQIGHQPQMLGMILRNAIRRA